MSLSKKHTWDEMYDKYEWNIPGNNLRSQTHGMLLLE